MIPLDEKCISLCPHDSAPWDKCILTDIIHFPSHKSRHSKHRKTCSRGEQSKDVEILLQPMGGVSLKDLAGMLVCISLVEVVDYCMFPTMEGS